ncbi:serine threonine protein kinase : Serine/threonine protein kinase OS=Trichodesmium erythraeum (strain IMS101) GN=Tery_2829 PE=4 SV=1: Pkinase: FGE-sulfatase [Gemmata massiliana]|uniref:Protein kinase domain-containing protein n=1 Tax=Gemmata massiliana TaxID=1210884 RepID=A0A6P2DBN4_9BACT|nr:bifunctional serine/threonine-protein kinase/formylglycine-generating enzyme family protein [Gemmata massiliana]VTR99138.1 serine threonine protein kinase : Serine/threonine protein kinase OS=Trichodesmium erythraeum (strain IMS101) GN=Tery_2829 PE=4 SV=1: Pkinase: FGE-sulfatase [Gemmata massiliana]
MEPQSLTPDPEVTKHRAADESADASRSHLLARLPPKELAQRYPFLSPPDRPGELGRLGPYRVMRLLGQGGMGIVFLAEEDELFRSVALKVMLPEMSSQHTARDRFKREGRAAAAIKSDHVVTIHQVGDANGVPYIAMEYLEGENLGDWLKTPGHRVTTEVVVRVAKGVLKGLAAAHRKKLIHRDIKPANLWLEAPSGRVKILDFGLTRGGDLDRNLTGENVILGTPAYMAPEQARGEGCDHRADLFSLGVVLYRMIAGQNPFQRGTTYETLIALHDHHPRPAASYGVVPAELAEMIDRLLSKSAAGRPRTARVALATVRAVERASRGEPGPARPVAGASVSLSAPEKSPVPLVTASTEEFDYVIEGKRETGARQVLELDLGSGQNMAFVRVMKGRFLMGAPDEEECSNINERPQHWVEIEHDFLLGIHAVTQAQYRAVTGESPSHFSGDRLPVENVSWEDAMAFCARLSDRTKWQVELPTEAEWEYACRAGTGTPFHFGSALNGEFANCDGTIPYGRTVNGVFKSMTAEVGSYPANAWGVHEMHGNVWEWCRDNYGPYPHGRGRGPMDPAFSSNPSEDLRVMRGGSWAGDAWICRAAARIRNPPRSRGYSSGFRVCIRPNA